jgi:hypothetical protein
MTTRTKLAVSALLVSTVYVRPVSADDAIANRFLQEAPRKWKEYESLLRGFDSTSEHANEFVPLDSKGKGEKQRQQEADHVIVDTLAKNALQKNTFENQEPEVYVSNPDYSIILRRNAIIGLAPSSASAFRHAERARKQRVSKIWSLYPLPLHDIINPSNFKVTAASEVQHEGESVVQIDFDFNTESKNFGPFKTFKGSVRLSPQKYWAVLGGTITVDDPKKQIGSYELNNHLGTFGSLPVIVGSEYLQYDPDHNLIGTMISKYSWNKFDGDMKRFRLPGYGFPDVMILPPE